MKQWPLIAIMIASSVSACKTGDSATALKEDNGSTEAVHKLETDLWCSSYMPNDKYAIDYLTVRGELAIPRLPTRGQWTADTVVTFKPVKDVILAASQRDNPDQDVSFLREKTIFIKNPARVEKSWHILAESGGKVVFDLELAAPELEADRNSRSLTAKGTLNVAPNLEAYGLPRKVNCTFSDSRIIMMGG